MSLLFDAFKPPLIARQMADDMGFTDEQYATNLWKRAVTRPDKFLGGRARRLERMQKTLKDKYTTYLNEMLRAGLTLEDAQKFAESFLTLHLEKENFLIERRYPKGVTDIVLERAQENFSLNEPTPGEYTAEEFEDALNRTKESVKSTKDAERQKTFVTRLWVKFNIKKLPGRIQLAKQAFGDALLMAAGLDAGDEMDSSGQTLDESDIGDKSVKFEGEAMRQLQDVQTVLNNYVVAAPDQPESVRNAIDFLAQKIKKKGMVSKDRAREIAKQKINDKLKKEGDIAGGDMLEMLWSVDKKLLTLNALQDIQNFVAQNAMGGGSDVSHISALSGHLSDLSIHGQEIDDISALLATPRKKSVELSFRRAPDTPHPMTLKIRPTPPLQPRKYELSPKVRSFPQTFSTGNVNEDILLDSSHSYSILSSPSSKHDTDSTYRPSVLDDSQDITIQVASDGDKLVEALLYAAAKTRDRGIQRNNPDANKLYKDREREIKDEFNKTEPNIKGLMKRLKLTQTTNIKDLNEGYRRAGGTIDAF
mmetsp:Transcript_5743/g.21760  ORF Transcript_5743/g.21760 Transcript_5743/m.21760 type:complete len:534 (-) Transcript_5743:1884-3485(-)